MNQLLSRMIQIQLYPLVSGAMAGKSTYLVRPFSYSGFSIYHLTMFDYRRVNKPGLINLSSWNHDKFLSKLIPRVMNRGPSNPELTFILYAWHFWGSICQKSGSTESSIVTHSSGTMRNRSKLEQHLGTGPVGHNPTTTERMEEAPALICHPARWLVGARLAGAGGAAWIMIWILSSGSSSGWSLTVGASRYLWLWLCIVQGSAPENSRF